MSLFFFTSTNPEKAVKNMPQEMHKSACIYLKMRCSESKSAVVANYVPDSVTSRWIMESRQNAMYITEAIQAMGGEMRVEWFEFMDKLDEKDGSVTLPNLFGKEGLSKTATNHMVMEEEYCLLAREIKIRVQKFQPVTWDITPKFLEDQAQLISAYMMLLEAKRNNQKELLAGLKSACESRSVRV